MISQKTKRVKELQSSLSSGSDNLPQLDSNLALFEPILDNVVKDSSHTSGLIFST